MAKILIVDDDPDIASVMRGTLERSGHSVAWAADGVSALELLGLGRGPATVRPDLALVDLVLPGLDGYALAARMRLDPELGRVPVLLLSARPDLTPLFGGAANVAAQLQKPFGPLELTEAVARALKAWGRGRPGPGTGAPGERGRRAARRLGGRRPRAATLR